MTRVMIVDDDYEVQYLAQRVINTLGWSFDAATNGTSAWQVIQEAVPDLVISEVDIPGMSGLDLTLSIKSDPRLSRLPVMLMGSPMLKGRLLPPAAMLLSPSLSMSRPCCNCYPN